MPDDGVSCYIKERLQHSVNGMLLEVLVDILTLGTSRESGLKRVPLEGPPTYGTSEPNILSSGTEYLQG